MENKQNNLRSAIDFLGNRMEFECMGCEIASGNLKVPGGIIFEGKHTILAADPEIPIPGFLIVNTKRHVKSFSELSREERIEMSDVIFHAEKSLKELNIIEELTLVQEERSRHFHIWIYPTYKWMIEKYGKGIRYFRDINEEAKQNVTEDIKTKTLEIIDNVRDYFKIHNITE